MYKGKPVIIAERPWWRSPIFPWGWYSMVQDRIDIKESIDADGYFTPSGGGGKFQWEGKIKGEDNE